MDWTGCEIVEVVVGKVSGVPLIKNTRVPADLVVGSLEAGESIEEVAYNFDLKPADVLVLKRFRDTHQPALHP
jgi:uncharacterized protein (DUF433 family)